MLSYIYTSLRLTRGRGEDKRGPGGTREGHPPIHPSIHHPSIIQGGTVPYIKADHNDLRRQPAGDKPYLILARHPCHPYLTQGHTHSPRAISHPGHPSVSRGIKGSCPSPSFKPSSLWRNQYYVFVICGVWVCGQGIGALHCVDREPPNVPCRLF